MRSRRFKVSEADPGPVRTASSAVVRMTWSLYVLAYELAIFSPSLAMRRTTHGVAWATGGGSLRVHSPGCASFAGCAWGMRSEPTFTRAFFSAGCGDLLAYAADGFGDRVARRITLCAFQLRASQPQAAAKADPERSWPSLPAHASARMKSCT
jgi:hypothetical protein